MGPNITAMKSITVPSSIPFSQERAREQRLEKIIGCYSKKPVSGKTVKTSGGINITASQAFLFSFFPFFLLVLQITLRDSFSSFFLSLLIPPSFLKIQVSEFTKTFPENLNPFADHPVFLCFPLTSTAVFLIATVL